MHLFRQIGFVIGVGSVVGVLVLSVARAQEGPPAKATAAPELSADVKRTLDEKRETARGYARAILVLQKELDAANADLGRAVEQVQRAYPGYELTVDPWALKKADVKK